MVASELVENAMKYGKSLPHIAVPVFCLSRANNNLLIEVANGATSMNSVNELRERIELIAKSPNREELYLSRLCEIMENRHQFGQLGLYRIGYEGGFTLTFDYSNEILSVTAMRGVP